MAKSSAPLASYLFFLPITLASHRDRLQGRLFSSRLLTASGSRLRLDLRFFVSGMKSPAFPLRA